MRKALSLIVLIAVFAAGFVLAQQTGNAVLEQGRAKKTAGDLQGAMEAFEKVVAEFAASERKAAANALLELGSIAESLGQLNRARGYYERVRTDFKDQTAEVATAGNRLNAPARGVNPAAPAGSRGAATRVTIRTPYAEDIYGFALSPDGKTVVFQVTTQDGKRQIWRQAVDAAAKPEPIAGTDGAGINARPFFAPDGKSIVFFAKQKVFQVDVAGGVPKELADAPFFYGGSWSADNSILLGIRVSSPFEVLKDGKLSATPMVSGVNFAAPQFIDDRRFLYFARDPRTQGQLEVASLDGQVTARGLPAAFFGTYTKGFLVYATPQGILNAVRFDPKELTTGGAPIVVADKVGIERRFVGVAAVTASQGGAIAYRESAVMDRQMLWMDRNGELLGTVGTADSSSPGLPRVSPDGRTVVYFRQQGAPLGSVWAMDTQTGATRQLQDGANVAIWSPAGDRIVIAQLRGRGGVPVGPYLTERPVAAAGGGRQFGPATGVVMPQDSTASGAILYLSGVSAIGSGTGDLSVLPPNSENPIPVAQTQASERNGRFSPDGKWIAYQSDEGGRNEVYVQPFPGSIDQRQRVSLNGGVSPQWGRAGKELYFISADNRLMVAEATPAGDKTALEFNTPKALFRSPLPQGAEYDTVNNGDRFLIMTTVGEPSPIVVLNNWMPPGN
jgi:Tol biopolymer transport system component